MSKKDIQERKKIVLFIVVFILCFSLFALFFVQVENDYFWHVKAGEFMFHNHLLKKDVFSWLAYHHKWISHEWLFELFLYTLKLLFPKTHLLVYCFLSLSILLLTLFFVNKEKYLKNIPFTLLWIAMSMILFPFLCGRPSILSFSLFSLTIFLLYDNYHKEDSKRIYFLPFIAIIWANIHGGSSNLVYLFCFLFYICSFFNFDFKKIYSNSIDKKKRRRYLIVMFLSMLCINLNLHGFDMFIYPYQNMMDITMLYAISEWQPTNLNDMTHYFYIVLVLLIFCILIFSRKKINFLDIILFFFSIYLGVKSIRFWPYTYIIMSYVVFDYISLHKIDSGTNLVLLFSSFCFLLIFVFNVPNIFSAVKKNYVSSSMIETIKQKKPKRLYNDYNIGGELLYNDILVFIDGRADLYSSLNLKDYLLINSTSGNYLSLINKYNFDYFIVEKESDIDYYLSYNDSYQVVFSDCHYNLYCTS